MHESSSELLSDQPISTFT